MAGAPAFPKSFNHQCASASVPHRRTPPSWLAEPLLNIPLIARPKEVPQPRIVVTICILVYEIIAIILLCEIPKYRTIEDIFPEENPIRSVPLGRIPEHHNSRYWGAFTSGTTS